MDEAGGWVFDRARSVYIDPTGRGGWPPTMQTPARMASRPPATAARVVRACDRIAVILVDQQALGAGVHVTSGASQMLVMNGGRLTLSDFDAGSVPLEGVGCA